MKKALTRHLYYSLHVMPTARDGHHSRKNDNNCVYVPVDFKSSSQLPLMLSNTCESVVTHGVSLVFLPCFRSPCSRFIFMEKCVVTPGREGWGHCRVGWGARSRGSFGTRTSWCPRQPVGVPLLKMEMRVRGSRDSSLIHGATPNPGIRLEG